MADAAVPDGVAVIAVDVGNSKTDVALVAGSGVVLAAARGPIPAGGHRFDVASYCFRREATHEIDDLRDRVGRPRLGHRPTSTASSCATRASTAPRPSLQPPPAVEVPRAPRLFGVSELVRAARNGPRSLATLNETAAEVNGA